MGTKSLVYIIGVVLLAACSKVETSDNGHLDGFWHLRSIDTLQTGGRADLAENGLTWAFQGEIMEVRDVKKVHQDLILHFQHSEGQLRLSEPYLVDRDHGDVALEDAELLRPYGIQGLSETFRVVELSSGSMVLESPVLRLHFRKN